MVLDITISEPWDFQSSDGENILRVKVIKKNKQGIWARVLSQYKDMTHDIYRENRKEKGHVNIYHLTDAKLENKKFVMIGKIKT